MRLLVILFARERSRILEKIINAANRNKRSAFESATILLRLILFYYFYISKLFFIKIYSEIALSILRSAKKIRFSYLKIRLNLFKYSFLLLSYFSIIYSILINLIISNEIF